MSEKRKEVIKRVLLSRHKVDGNKITDINVCSFEADKIFLVPEGRTGNLTIFVPSSVMDLTTNEMEKQIKEMKCVPA